jgi:hypothetical protein
VITNDGISYHLVNLDHRHVNLRETDPLAINFTNFEGARVTVDVYRDLVLLW